MNFYLGDFPEDATVNVIFNTFTSDDPSASCTITNLLNTDIHIHKDDGLTQRNNAAGITVSINFDGITGNHMVKIDTSDDTVAGFWVTGSDYYVRMEGVTIDGGTVNTWIGHFSIENRYNEVDVVKWLGQACHAVSENGVPKVDLDQIGGVVQSLTDFKDLVDTGYDPTNHKVQSDLIYIHGSALTETAGQLAAAFIKLFDVATPLLVASDVMVGTDNAATEAKQDIIDTNLDTVLDDTNELQTNQGAWATATGFSTHSAADVWSATVDEATVGAAPTTAKTKLQAIWNRLFTKKTITASLETAYESDNTTTMETWTLADDDTTAARTQ